MSLTPVIEPDSMYHSRMQFRQNHTEYQKIGDGLFGVAYLATKNARTDVIPQIDPSTDDHVRGQFSPKAGDDTRRQTRSMTKKKREELSPLPPTTRPKRAGKIEKKGKGAPKKQRRVEPTLIQERPRTTDKIASPTQQPKDLIVVKYNKPVIPRMVSKDQADMTHEVSIMKSLGDTFHGVLPLLESHIDGSTQWMTAPFMNGGSLVDFSRKHEDAITIPFVWHVAHGLAESLLYMYFGITSVDTKGGAQPAPEWNATMHGDLHSGNILLTAASPERQFANFPAIVVADFGSAIPMSGPGAADTEVYGELSFFDYAAIEVGETINYVTCALAVIAETAQREKAQGSEGWPGGLNGGPDIMNQELKKWVEKWWYERLQVDDGEVVHTPESVLEILLEVRAVAATERWKKVQPMPDHAVAAFTMVPILTAAPEVEKRFVADTDYR